MLISPPPCTHRALSLSAHLQGRALSTPLPTQHCTNMSAAPCSEVGPEMWGGDGMCSNSSNHTWVCSKEFMLRYRGPANCWIGLHRAEGDEHWTWADGSAFTNWSVCASVCRGGISYGVCLAWAGIGFLILHPPVLRFELRGRGQCAYLNGDRISSALCHNEKFWVCSRADSYVRWRKKALLV